MTCGLESVNPLPSAFQRSKTSTSSLSKLTSIEQPSSNDVIKRKATRPKKPGGRVVADPLARVTASQAKEQPQTLTETSTTITSYSSSATSVRPPLPVKRVQGLGACSKKMHREEYDDTWDKENEMSTTEVINLHDDEEMIKNNEVEVPVKVHQSKASKKKSLNKLSVAPKRKALAELQSSAKQAVQAPDETQARSLPNAREAAVQALDLLKSILIQGAL